MKIIDFDLTNVPTDIPELNICLGYFDGVHIGHQKILSEAKKDGHKVAMLTFNSSPRVFLERDDNKRCLSCVDDKAYYCELFGVDYLLVMPFDDQIKNTSHFNFVNYVLKVLNPHAIYCGEDYRFGKDALGTPDFLKDYFETHVISLLEKDDKKVSSRTIREAIASGNIKLASSLLGHDYRIGGYVVSGERNGRTIGFPTANLDLDFPYVMPKIGVYMGYAFVSEEKYRALICVGTHPTFKELDIPIVEVHVIDYQGVLYGDFVFVEFTDYIRDIIKFEKVEDLVEQLNKDKEKTGSDDPVF